VPRPTSPDDERAAGHPGFRTGVPTTDKNDTLAGMMRATRRRLARDPDDERARWSLGEALRMQGDLDDALGCYRAALRANPDHPGAQWLTAILGEEDILPECPAGARAAPFVRDEAFLSDAEQDIVWGALRDAMDGMETASVGGGGGSDGDDEVNPKIRSSQVLYIPHLKALRSWFPDRVVARLKELWSRLGVEPFEIEGGDLQLTIHRHGDFYRTHRDSGDGDVTSHRRVTFVYYFHRQPRRFSGGDLLLYDTDVERDKWLEKYTRLDVRHNSILYFPSEYYHQVMPVVCETGDVEDGRLTLNGWIHGP